MKKILTSETFLSIVASVIITLVVFLVFLWATAHEQWYVGKHDSKCEKTFDDESCECYERLVAADKVRCTK